MIASTTIMSGNDRSPLREQQRQQMSLAGGKSRNSRDIRRHLIGGTQQDTSNNYNNNNNMQQQQFRTSLDFFHNNRHLQSPTGSFKEKKPSKKNHKETKYSDNDKKHNYLALYANQFEDDPDLTYIRSKTGDNESEQNHLSEQQDFDEEDASLSDED